MSTAIATPLTARPTFDSEAENLAAAKTRSNRVKSELITRQRLNEECFITKNHSGSGDYVTVRLVIPADKDEEARLAAERAEQERIAAEQAERQRLAAEKAEAERIAVLLRSRPGPTALRRHSASPMMHPLRNLQP